MDIAINPRIKPVKFLETDTLLQITAGEKTYLLVVTNPEEGLVVIEGEDLLFPQVASISGSLWQGGFLANTLVIGGRTLIQGVMGQIITDEVTAIEKIHNFSKVEELVS